MKQIKLLDGKKEDIVKILNQPNGSFLFVGQKGTVVGSTPTLERETKTIWDLCSKIDMNYCKCRKMRMSTFQVTDATYLDVSGHYCIATSNRTLHFLHVTSTDQWETFRLTDLPTIPISLENNFKETNQRQTCDLFIGDHVGSIYIFTFLFPRTMLFNRNFSTEIQSIEFQDLKSHRDYVVCRKLRNVHNDFVDKIQHIWECNLLLSNAKRDVKRSLISQDMNGKTSCRILHHKKGVTCFDGDYRSAAIATGSKDFLVRTWKMSVPHECVHTLHGHCAVVADVRLWSAQKMLMSICKELELKIWNIESGHLLRSFLTRLETIHREPYFGKSVLHISESKDSFILITCADFITEVEVEEVLDVCKFPETDVNFLYIKHLPTSKFWCLWKISGKMPRCFHRKLYGYFFDYRPIAQWITR